MEVIVIKPIEITLLSALILLVLSFAAQAADSDYKGTVIPYPVPDAVGICPYSVTVNGQPMPIEKAGNYQGAYYVRFQLAGKARVSIKVKATAATIMTLKPERFKQNVETPKSELLFDVEEPGVRVITVNCGSKDLWPVIIFAEPISQEETFPSGTKIYRVKDYVSGEGSQTKNIQKALDECAANGGGVVRFDQGIYITGPIFIGSNTVVQMAPGSLIQATIDPSEYAEKPELDPYESRTWHTGWPGLINFYNAENSRLTGPGVIDGMGNFVRDEHGLNIREMAITTCKNVTVEDVMLRHSATWTVHIMHSNDVVFDGVNIVADWAVGNSDGINPDCSQNVTIKNCFGYCGDDVYAVKATLKDPKAQDTKNILVTDCMAMTRKNALKIGTETHQNISDVTFQNVEAVNTVRGVGFYMLDGAIISNITCKNLNFDLVEYPVEGWSGSPFAFFVKARRQDLGKIDGVTLENIKASGSFTSGLYGDPNSKIENVTFRNIEFTVNDRIHWMEKMPLLDLRNCKDWQFEDFTVIWNTDLIAPWTGLIRLDNCENVDVSGITEVRAENEE